ncbi:MULTISPECIES: multidrug transporter subunit MdtN [unclassified Variovorax]|uniref:multidrug transporter subunit MdtN n=1 Tax=Variovorax sp. Sphag1AA TaxID=2587027 RepID=UPI001611D0C4|nr:multidrug efflux system membrane fusion protein [Variovorax sp. Sphag1AA]
MTKNASRSSWGRRLALSLAIIAVCTVVAVGVNVASRPSTDDATIDADIVHVASAVGGRIIELPVRENQQVRKGDLLFQIDPLPYKLAVTQAQANVDVARAALDSQRRLVSTQRSAAVTAADQTRRATTNLSLTERTEERLRPLVQKGYVPQQQLDQAQTARQDAATSVRQAKEQAAAAERAIADDAGGVAAVAAAEAALAIAKRALDDTSVRAPHDGRVVGLTVSPGEMVIPSQSLFTLINTEEWFAIANLRETDLHQVQEGQCATVYSMLDRRQPIRGVVDGIGWGVLADDRVNLPRSLPYVQSSLNWVRVARRFPVRVRLEEPPPALTRVGASAVVEVGHGAACR